MDPDQTAPREGHLKSGAGGWARCMSGRYVYS